MTLVNLRYVENNFNAGWVSVSRNEEKLAVRQGWTKSDSKRGLRRERKKKAGGSGRATNKAS